MVEIILVTSHLANETFLTSSRKIIFMIDKTTYGYLQRVAKITTNKFIIKIISLGLRNTLVQLMTIMPCTLSTFFKTSKGISKFAWPSNVSLTSFLLEHKEIWVSEMIVMDGEGLWIIINGARNLITEDATYWTKRMICMKKRENEKWNRREQQHKKTTHGTLCGLWRLLSCYERSEL